MMMPFDGTGAPQQGQPGMAPQMGMPPLPPGANPSPAGMPGPGGHHQQGGPMGGPPPYGGHRNSLTMPGQPPFLPPQSPQQQARQGSFTGSIGGSVGPPPPHQYAGHPPLHSPHQAHQQQQPGGPPMHPSMMQQQQQQHRTSMSSHSGRHGSSGMGPQGGGGMPQHPGMVQQQQQQQQQHHHQQQHHDPMRGSSSQGTHNRHQQQQQQQQYMGNSSSGSGGGAGGSSGGLAGSWQSDNDTPHRREMIQQIVKLLKKDKSGSPEALAKLPQMAKQLEVSLYRNAQSFEAYMDMSTLKKRLQLIAAEVQRKTRGQSSSDSSSRDARGYTDRSSSSQQQPQHRQQQQDQYPNGMRSEPSGGASPFMGNSSQNGRMASMNEINPMANSGGAALMRQHTDASGYNSRASMNDGRGAVPQSTSANRNDPEWKMRIKHKQQRLLLLHHSAKCPHEDGRCTVTQHCADMKRLWRHMEGCKDNNCRVPHCFSSRAILSHYRKCKDPSCPACSPVRSSVRKSKSGTLTPGGSAGSPMMNTSLNSHTSMRGPPPLQQPPPQQPHGGMMSQMDPLAQSASFQSTSSSVGASSFQQPSRSGHSMPPPGPGGVPGPSMSNSSSGRQQYPSSSQYQQHSSSGSMNGGGSLSSAQPAYRSSSQKQQQQGGPDNSAAQSSSSRENDLLPSSSSSRQPPSGGGGGGSSSRQSDSEWQKIRHKQQRLLLLRHASRCQHEAGKCPVTPHCASMKKLWEHIAHCKNQQCTVQHCLSSRYVLSHYRRCKDPNCPACGPVRETIRKSHEREKSRQQQPGGSPPMQPSDRSIDNAFAPSSPPPESYQPERKRIKTDHHPQPAVPVPSQPLEQPSAEVAPSATAAVPAPPQPAPSPQQPPAAAPAQAVQKPVKVESAAKKEAADEKGAADYSLLNSFTVKQLETHLASLDRKTQLPPAKLKSKCLEVLKGLQVHQHGWVFNCPVDPVELGLPDYFNIIKKPMDLGTVQKKLESGAYHEITDFQTDCFLTFDNAMTYNEDGSVVYDMAKELMTRLESDMKKLLEQLEAEDLQRRQNERACTLCGCEKLMFEPPIYFCNGMNCQNLRIRRNSHFYIGGNNQYFWCTTCYNELDDKIPIELVDMTIMKGDMKKKKNDEVHEESWVQCDTCERWVHQICGLFNTRQNREQHSEYCCPRCLCNKQKTTKSTPQPKPPGAADLPRTMLSEWLEKHIMKKVDARRKQLTEERAQTENTSLEEASNQVEAGGPIFIRQVTSIERKLEVRELMKKRYAHKNYPEEFPFRSKCIVVFQELDGVDVILFALYLYEHGEDSPPPNQRRVYISYLDSVHFMRPRQLRTFVYHEILIAYLDYARRRGFATAHIWACPPLKGDDYIFYSKPEDQKTPRDSRLRLWYIDLLVECQKRNIVGKLTNMYDLYFADDKIDATSVPYLEGDYFPGEAENIIKMIEEGGEKKGGAGGKKKKSKNSAKNKGSTGTRSTGVDEEALIASGMCENAKSLKDLDRDIVMVKLGETIQPMKDSFIVAFLNWSGANEEDMAVPPEIEKARIEYAAKGENDITGSKRDAVGNIRDSMALLDKDGKPIKVIDDDDEDLDCEFLNNRQAFLNLCRGNHYQFDELRRAKHTSMMVLWHLHNRDAPKFVQQCVACSREILSGMRYHCNTCPDYDLCQECFKNPSTNRGACTHKLQPIAVDSEANQERSGLTEAERQQRQRNLMLHIQLIEHASRCTSKNCTSSNCAKMKSYLQHSRGCRVKATGGCRICKRIWTLLRIHAQKCKDRNCPIPQCQAIREKMRQLQKQQQAMDDRRRLEMNRHMRFSMTAGVAGR